MLKSIDSSQNRWNKTHRATMNKIAKRQRKRRERIIHAYEAEHPNA